MTGWVPDLALKLPPTGTDTQPGLYCAAVAGFVASVTIIMDLTMTVPILAVADYFISKADPQAGDPMTHLKLQKLAYYAQAWHLALLDAPLVADGFEAWVHGPVARSLYDRFQAHGWQPIGPDQMTSNPEQTLPADTRVFLDEIWEVYGQYTAKHLEAFTHIERPWTEAREGLSPIERSAAPISVETMKAYYREVAQRHGAEA